MDEEQRYDVKVKAYIEISLKLETALGRSIDGFNVGHELHEIIQLLPLLRPE